MADQMPRGAIPSSPSDLAGIEPHIPDASVGVPASFLSWPDQLSYWGNNSDGDCVSAEEAFAKVVVDPFIFIPESTLVAWAKQYGFLNGATLPAVMTVMNTKGLMTGGGTVFDGAFKTVDWTNAATLQSAISTQGPVKLGVAADSFQSNSNGLVTPGKNGWAMFDYPSGLPLDHCVGLCGYGNLSDLVGLFKTLGDVTVDIPKGMPTGLCYAFFTWESVGIVDEQSLMNMTSEAYVRNPVTTYTFPSVSVLSLYNDGGFVCDIHALYRNPDVSNNSDAANRENFPIAQTRTMTLSSKCTDPAIAAGDLVQLKVWVQAGHDNTYGGIFIYDPNGPTQRFKISGSTLNNSIEYLGT